MSPDQWFSPSLSLGSDCCEFSKDTNLLVKNLHTQAKVYIQLQEIQKYPQTYLKTLNDEQDVSRYNPSPQEALSPQLGNGLPYIFFLLASQLHPVSHMGGENLNDEHLSQER